jgi:hypothetical protein
LNHLVLAGSLPDNRHLKSTQLEVTSRPILPALTTINLCCTPASLISDQWRSISLMLQAIPSSYSLAYLLW